MAVLNFEVSNNISEQQTFFCGVATHNFGMAILYFGAAMNISEWQDIFRSEPGGDVDLFPRLLTVS